MPSSDYWFDPKPKEKVQWKDIPLSQHLGLKERQLVLILWPPAGFIERLGHDYAQEGRYDLEPDLLEYDYIHSFITSKIVLENMLPTLINRLNPTGMLWVSFPTRQADNRSDLNRRLVREICMARGLLETKSLKIDNDWTALKFIHDPHKPIHFSEKREVLRFGL